MIPYLKSSYLLLIGTTILTCVSSLQTVTYETNTPTATETSQSRSTEYFSNSLNNSKQTDIHSTDSPYSGEKYIVIEKGDYRILRKTQTENDPPSKSFPPPKEIQHIVPIGINAVVVVLLTVVITAGVVIGYLCVKLRRIKKEKTEANKRDFIYSDEHSVIMDWGDSDTCDTSRT